MRSSNKRSRSKSNRPKPLGNIVNRVFDSSGPEGKVRGTPQQIIDKYLVLARDAQLSGDRVAAENFLQHAEHYTRMLSEAQREMAREAEARQPQGNNQNRRFDQRDDGDGGQDSGESAEAQGGERQNDRQNGEGGGNRRVNRREDRAERPERRPRPQRDQAETRSAQPGRAEDDSMLVETPESRAEIRSQPPADITDESAVRAADASSAADSAPAPAPDAPAEAAEAQPEPKPRKPRAATTTRRAPRKPKAEDGGAEQGTTDSDPARVAE